MASKSPEAKASEEAKNRTEADKPAYQVQAEDQAANNEPTPSEVFEVQVNRKLSGMRSVVLEGKRFFYDNTMNAAKGTTELDDLQYDRISKVKEPETSAQYIVKKPQGGGN